MAFIQNVSEVDDLARLNSIVVSCTDKSGLVSNERNIPNFPQNGILGRIAEINNQVQFISTGETYNHIKDAHLNVIEMGEYTGYPEMKTGLVKS